MKWYLIPFTDTIFAENLKVMPGHTMQNSTTLFPPLPIGNFPSNRLVKTLLFLHIGTDK